MCAPFNRGVHSASVKGAACNVLHTNCNGSEQRRLSSMVGDVRCGWEQQKGHRFQSVHYTTCSSTGLRLPL